MVLAENVDELARLLRRSTQSQRFDAAADASRVSRDLSASTAMDNIPNDGTASSAGAAATKKTEACKDQSVSSPYTEKFRCGSWDSVTRHFDSHSSHANRNQHQAGPNFVPELPSQHAGQGEFASSTDPSPNTFGLLSEHGPQAQSWRITGTGRASYDASMLGNFCTVSPFSSLKQVSSEDERISAFICRPTQRLQAELHVPPMQKQTEANSRKCNSYNSWLAMQSELPAIATLQTKELSDSRFRQCSADSEASSPVFSTVAARDFFLVPERQSGLTKQTFLDNREEGAHTDALVFTHFQYLPNSDLMRGYPDERSNIMPEPVGPISQVIDPNAVQLGTSEKRLIPPGVSHPTISKHRTSGYQSTPM